MWTDLKDAVRGTHPDYTQGAVGRAILLLSVPMILETPKGDDMVSKDRRAIALLRRFRREG